MKRVVDSISRAVGWSAGLLAIGVATTVAAAPKADPAFLGVVMMDIAPGMVPVGAIAPGVTPGVQGGISRCLVTQVTTGSGADDAGLRAQDLILTIDGKPIPSCSRLTEIITAHDHDDVVTIEVTRGSDAFAPSATPRKISVSAKLSSRSQVLRRAYMGRPVSAELVGTDALDEIQSLDLSSLKGRTGIVGWFAPACDAACAPVFARVAKWTRGTRAVAYGVTYQPALPLPQDPSETHKLRNRYRLDVPLAVASDPRLDASGAPVIFDTERIMFMVIDANNVVSYVASIAPGAEDLEAALDELKVAVDNARLARR